MSEVKVKGSRGLVDDAHVYDLNESIRASKYPMSADISKLDGRVTPTVLSLGNSKAGAGHDNFLCGIRASFDLTFTNKAWIEAERYHFFDIVSSQSTMHRITKLDQFDGHVDQRSLDVLQEKIEAYEQLRLALVAKEDDVSELDVEDAYLDILFNIPAGLSLTARISTNYRQLKTIYYQRKNHRLPEWRQFCNWMITELPMFKDLIQTKEEKVVTSERVVDQGWLIRIPWSSGGCYYRCPASETSPLYTSESQARRVLEKTKILHKNATLVPAKLVLE